MYIIFSDIISISSTYYIKINDNISQYNYYASPRVMDDYLIIGKIIIR